ncbi:MAG: TonB-dependent receptor plug domain-containing protein [Pseudomonadota bacterium]
MGIRKFASGGSVLALVMASGAVSAQTTSIEDDDVIIVEGSRIGGELGLKNESEVGGRLGLSLLETPGNVELIDAQTIDLRGDFGAIEAVTRSTGITSAATPGNGNTSLSSRGFSGHSSTVTMYDGTRLYVGAGTVTFPADTWTLDRVEVLHGAASVIHGVGAIGAAINYVPMKPSFDGPSGRGHVSAGDNGFFRGAGGGNIVLSDTVAARFDAAYTRDDGYIDRAEETRFVVAGSLLWQPSDDFSATFMVDYSDVEPAPYWGTPLINGSVAVNRRENYNVEDGVIEFKDFWPRLRLDWDISPNVSLRSDTYYIDAERQWTNLESYEYNPGTDLVDRSFYLEIFHDQEQFGHRMDVRFDNQLGDMMNRLSIGGEINRIEFTHTNNSPFSGTTSVPVNDFDPGQFINVAGTTLDYMTTNTLLAQLKYM